MLVVCFLVGYGLRCYQERRCTSVGVPLSVVRQAIETLQPEEEDDDWEQEARAQKKLAKRVKKYGAVADR